MAQLVDTENGENWRWTVVEWRDLWNLEVKIWIKTKWEAALNVFHDFSLNWTSGCQSLLVKLSQTLKSLTISSVRKLKSLRTSVGGIPGRAFPRHPRRSAAPRAAGQYTTVCFNQPGGGWVGRRGLQPDPLWIFPTTDEQEGSGRVPAAPWVWHISPGLVPQRA